ncbi:MAG: ArnT family glycosyltransferase [Candidatus Omnitrophota bacterium]
MKTKQLDLITCLFIVFLSLFIFVNGLNVHGFEFRDDEIFYVKSTTEMVQSGNIMSPKYFGEDRFQKPILFYWLILLSYKMFGISWFSARFVSCLFAAATLVVTWLTAKSLFNRRVANLATLILMTMPLFFRHAKNAVPDVALNFFVVLALYFFVRFNEEKQASRYSLLFFIACALGFMIKGFAAIIVPFMTIILYSAYKREWSILKGMHFLKGLAVLFLIVSPWFLYMLNLHGIDYFKYMWFKETSDRLLNVEGGNFFLVKSLSFLEHAWFYFQIILQQFAPWSVISYMGLGYALTKIRKKGVRNEAVVFLFFWVFVVYFFFSFMYFTISHYMLVMTAPVAILTSYFLLYSFETNSISGRILTFSRTYYVVFVFSLLALAYSFIMVFFANLSMMVLVIIGMLYVVSVRFVLRSNSPMAGPIVLGGVILLIGFQTSYLSNLGLTTHTTLRKFAETINQQHLIKYSIGVGSHDLHEKELQIYFSDVRVEKVANDNDQYTTYMLKQLFGKNESVYCLITEKDYNKYLKDIFENTKIIQKEFILRKQLNIDRGFLVALLNFDRQRIYDYFMESVVLVKREKDV